MTELVLRIIVEHATPGSHPGAVPVLVVQGGSPMQPMPRDGLAFDWTGMLERYLTWGRTQGGKTGGPWSPDHLRQTTKRCQWWVEKLAREPFDLGSLPLARLEELAQAIGRRFDRRGKVLPVAPKTRKDYLAALLAWRTWAERRDLIRIPVPDPLRALRKPSGEAETEWRGLTAEEFQQLLAVAPMGRREIYSVMALTGLRRREFRDLKVKYFDKANQRLVIPAGGSAIGGTKNAKKAYVPLPPCVFEFVAKRAQHKEPDDDLYVFSKTALSRKFGEDCEAAGIQRVTPEGKAVLHGMRDTAASVLQQMGYSLTLAAKFVRHGDERLTRKRYTNISADEIGSAAAALGDRLGIALEPTEARDAANPASPCPSQPVCNQEVSEVKNGGRTGTRTPPRDGVSYNFIFPNGLGLPQGASFGQQVGALIDAALRLPEARRADGLRTIEEVLKQLAAIPPDEPVNITSQVIKIEPARPEGSA